MRRERDRLQDILGAIGRVEEYASRGRANFDVDPLIQTWIVHHIAIIGEACRARAILVHHYFDIDTDAVWAVVEKDLPDLKRNVARILEQITAEG